MAQLEPTTPDPLQRRLWFLERLGPDGGSYVTPAAVRLRGPLDQRALDAAVDELPRRHPDLCTRCVDREGVPILETETPAPLLRIDADAVSGIEDLVPRLAGTSPFSGALIAVGAQDHVLLVVVHQSVGDATTAAWLMAELGALYSGHPTAPAPPVAEPVPAVGDGWLESLEDTPPVEVPEDRRRPQTWQGASATLRFAVPEAFTAAYRAELPAALLTAVHTLLARHSSRWEGVVGFRHGASTVPVPLNLPADLPFGDALALTATAMARARGADADVLAEQLAGAPDLSRNPLFGVLVEIVDEPPAEFGALDVEPFRVSARTTRYDLVVRVRRRAGAVTGEIEYATALLSREAAARLAGQLSALCAVTNDSTRIDDLDILPPAERSAVLPTVERTATAEATVPELIAAQAASTPDAVAVECGEDRLTYAELIGVANALAHRLRELGVRRGQLVAVALPRGVTLLGALIGIHQVGAAYLPLDPEHPAGRLATVLADSGTRVVVTSSTLRDTLPQTSPITVEMDDIQAGATARWHPVTPDDAAYVIYTSGSTGRPKGVLVTHRALSNFLDSMRERPGLPPGAVFPAVTTVAFDIAALELFLPLLVGGRVVLSEDTEASDPDRLAALLARIGARVMQATPVTWRMLLDSGWRPPRGFTALCGGEKLPGELAGRMCAAGMRLWDLYGPTETTVWSAVAGIEDGAVSDFAAVANTTLYVLDERLQPVPLGARGELYIGGDGVAAGYLGRPALTADRFVPDPYGGDGRRLYRTGDVARRHPDGRIEIVGRADDQIKIRGFRVEPGEVESALVALPDVDAALAHAVAGPDGDVRLAGYIRAAGDRPAPSADELSAQCAKLLPSYMVPTRFVVIDEFPTTPNGKIDRAALPAPAAPSTPSSRGDQPSSPTEHAIANVLAEVLDLREIGAHDDFFALGGHSLSATRAVSRLRTEFGVELPVSAMFEARTVSRIAMRLTAATTALDPVVPVRHEPLPLTFAQRRMWFLHQLDPDSTAYLEPLAVRLAEPLDPDRLDLAVSLLFERHEILRTRYPVDDAGEPVRQVDSPVPIRLTVEDRDPRDVLAEELSRPFDLAAAPPVRLRLVRGPDGAHTVLIVAHHIATDDRSGEVLADELRTAYEGGEPPPPPIRYADYAAWQRDRMAGEFAKRELAFWRERLAGMEPTELLTDRARPAVHDPRAGTVRFTVPAALLARLDEIGGQHRATRFITLMAGFLAILGRYTGRRDLAVGVPASGRNRPELEDLVGLFVNTVVLRAELDGDSGFADFLRTVRDRAVTAYQHADLPFDLLVEDLAPHRDLSRNPLFGILFTTHGPARPSGFEYPDPHDAKCDLSAHLTDREDGGLDGRFEYAAALFERETIARFAEHYVRLLEAVAQSPDTPVGQLSLGATAEREGVPATEAAPPAGTVVDLIAAQAAAAAGAVAVTGAGRTLTYAELEHESNQLAHRLRELGARRDRFVAVRVPPGADLVVALLGVLKSGAAYIPLDPEHPGERLTHALRESAAPLVIGSAGSAPELPASTRLVAMDEPAERDRIRMRPTGAPENEVFPDDLAYAVYTSGSTGRPKAAMVTHGGLAAFTSWARSALRPESGAGSPLHTSIAFDLVLTSLYPALAAGAPVHLVTDASAGVEPLAETLAAAEEPYGLVKLTPTHLDLLTEALPAHTLAGAARCLVIAGEQLRGEQLADLSARAPHARVVNSYGPSETTIACCVHDVAAGEVPPGPVPIGRPIPGSTIHLLDGAMRPVPAGVAGEIHVGGRGVGRGYLADPRRTADRFVPDPYGTEPGGRLYRTGDLARRRTDGTLVFLGRTDHQVKIRGFRVEPGEVESALDRHPAVRAAAVVVDRSEPGNPRLAAHVVTDPHAEPVPTAELRAYLAARLPSYLVPTLLGTLPELPLLRNGKVDRRSLPKLAPPDGTAGIHVAPTGPAERAIAGVWADVLGVERIGRHDRFFDLGGQSLLATRVAARLRELFPVAVSVRDVFAAQTVATLAETVTRGAAAPQPTPIVRVSRSAPLPLSFAQQRLWLLHQMNPAGTEYLVTTALRLRGPLDVEALGRALRQVLARHEVLRTRYVTDTDGQPLQVIDDPPRTGLAVENADPGAVLREEAGTPIDLAAGPVLRARLVRAGADEHVLVLVIHHIAVDAWSNGTLAAELEAAYRGATPAEPPVQYADFAAWQRARLTGPVLADLLRYWRSRLAGLEPTELPADRPRPAVRDAAGAVRSFTVPPGLAARLDELGRRNAATPFMTYLAGFFALLARYTGRTDLAVGVPVSGRSSTQVEDLIGFFANTVVLRADLAASQSFTRLLGQVRDVAADGYAHDELPFERLVEELVSERDLSRNPMFQVMFALREGTPGQFRLGTLDVVPEPVPTHTAKFDLTVELIRHDDGSVSGEVEYATALFDPATVDRFVCHYLHLLGEAASRPETDVSALEVLEESERRALTAHGTGAQRPRPDLGLPELVARQAERTPDAVAVAAGTDRLTYRELDAAANRVAHRLRAVGVGRDDVVGLCLPRRPDLVVALLGVLRAGAAFLPLDRGHPVERLGWMLDDARAELVIVDTEPPAGLPVTVLRLADRAATDAQPSGPAPVTTDPDALAYVIYTSGSTGRPKGVAVPHRGIRNRVLWAVQSHGLGESDRLIQKTAITFDACVWEILAPLVSGGTVVLAPEGAERDPAMLVDVLAEQRITVLQGVPSFLRELANEPGLGRCTSLRLLFSAGEPLAAELAARLCSLVPATLVNTYGPTESSIDVTSWVFEPGSRNGTVPIGLPLDNTRALVLTPEGGLAPVGVPGELHIAGEGLARGYLGRPRLTADRFVPDPYGPPGARAYRTGDVTRRLPDGALEFVGRTDQQVKVRGVRVEPGEVEAVLSGHPDLTAAAVTARPGPDGSPRLVGYLVPAADPLHSIRDYLLARLPEPYVPSVFVTLDRLPVTSSGKVDRASLPEPGHERADDAAPDPAGTPDEKLIADILAGVLGLDAVGRTEDFFELGGHSLLAIRLVGRLRAAFGVPLDVRAVFEDRTVAALAARVSERAGEPTAASVLPARRERGAAVPLSFAQQRLWFLHELAAGSSPYQVSWVLRLTGPLDTDALAGALTDLSARHEILRTRYGTGDDGDPVQIVQQAGPVRLPVTEPAGAQEPSSLIRTLVDRPFDLSARPPFAAHLIRLGAEDHVFLLVMHHIVTDGWSETVMARELSELYRARMTGSPPALRPEPTQYGDYALWQRSNLTGAVLDRELRHWRERLAGSHPLELPTDLPRPAILDGRGARTRLPLPAGIARPLLDLGRRRGATPFMTFLSVFCALMSRYTGATDLTVATAVAGRNRPELENAVGFFVNTVVVRADIADDPAPATLIERVREEVLDAFTHDELPFDRLVEELAPQRDLSRSPLCDVAFGVREAPPEAPRLDGVDVRPVDLERTTAKFDLTCTLTAGSDGGYEIELEYATALFTEATMQRLAGHFRALAESVAHAPDRAISDLSVMDSTERDTVLRKWNESSGPASRECVHEAFAVQAARTPDALAVEGAGERLTYAELAMRSADLARRLCAAGLRCEEPVAVYLDRSPDAAVVLLAVLQAGGTYVPLDTTHPAERLALTVEDLRPGVVVTQRRLLERLADVPVPVVAVEDTDAAPTVGDLPPGDPDRLAYMIYTSGSTGRPKAVMVPHDAYTHHCRTHADVHDIRPGDRVLLHAALSFDPAMAQLAATWLAGATVVVDRPGVVAPSELPDRLADRDVTHVAVAASYYRDVMASVRRRDPRLRGLRVMAVGGEVVPGDAVQQWNESELDGRLVCVYGPTETTVASLSHQASVRDLATVGPRAPLPIGRPIPGTRAYVLDDRLRPVPTGVAGELFLGGMRLARGYLRRPRLTAERFVPDPFGGTGERLYRTGDLVRYRPDGVVEFLGRIDTQVKLRGYRIELGEIEAALAGHPDVQAAAAAVREVAPGDHRLVGYVVPRPGSAPSRAELRSHLRHRVPEYMVPSVWLTLPDLPHGASQKVDRRALPIPDPGAATGYDGGVPPRTEVEEAIAGAWADVLGLPAVGVDDDFFGLGGHSLLATRLMTRLNRLFGLEIPLRTLFEATTVGEQAVALEALAESAQCEAGA